MEGRITTEYLDIIWTAAQLKHCSKPVHDLLPSLIKHLSVNAALHLYNLLTKLETREHTEQTLYLASALIKFIWTRSGASSAGGVSSDIGFVTSSAGIGLHKCTASSSENSVSIDGSNSDEEPGETSAQSESHKSGTEEEEEEEEEEDEDELLDIDREGPTPCKQARTHHEEKKDLPEGVETIASSSDEEEHLHHLHHHHLAKRHLRQKCRKRQGRIRAEELLHHEEDSDLEVKPIKHRRVKSRSARIREQLLSVYVNDSSSGSESGKIIGPRALEACRQPFIPEVPRDEHLLELLSGDEIEGEANGSYSSRMSNKSEKNMGDFDGEDSVCDEELAHLAAQAQDGSGCVVNLGALHHRNDIEKSPGMFSYFLETFE